VTGKPIATQLDHDRGDPGSGGSIPIKCSIPFEQCAHVFTIHGADAITQCTQHPIVSIIQWSPPYEKAAAVARATASLTQSDHQKVMARMRSERLSSGYEASIRRSDSQALPDLRYDASPRLMSEIRHGRTDRPAQRDPISARYNARNLKIMNSRKFKGKRVSATRRG
jgi:hypothetical protein